MIHSLGINQVCASHGRQGNLRYGNLLDAGFGEVADVLA